MTNIGFLTISNPLGLGGSPIINGVSSSDRSYVILDYSGISFDWSGVSLLLWLNLENDVQDTPLLLLVNVVQEY